MSKKSRFSLPEHRKKGYLVQVRILLLHLPENSRKWKEPQIIFAQRVQRNLLEIQARLFAWMGKLLLYALVSFNNYVDQILPNFDPLSSSSSGQTWTS